MIFQYFVYLLITFVAANAEHYSGDVEVYEGQPFSIECSGLRAPGLTKGDEVYWTKDGASFISFNTGKIRVTRPNSTSSMLYVQEARKTYGGTYRCLRNAVSSWNLTVKKPVVKNIPVYVKLGDPWNITCKKLHAFQKVQWLKNSTSIEELSSGEIRVITTCQESVLQSDSARLEHMGSYTCTPDSRIVYFLHPLEEIKYSGTQTVWEHESWYIQCDDLQRSLNGFEWRKDGKTIDGLASGDIRIEKTSTGGSKLFSNYAKSCHSGNYSCTKYGNDSFQLQVKQGMNHITNRLISTYNDSKYDVSCKNTCLLTFSGATRVLEGKPWNIFCTVSPGAYISWLRNGKTIPELETGEIEVRNVDQKTNKTSVLISKSANMLHAGCYQCTSSSSKSWYFSVKKAKKIKVLEEGGFLDLECANASETERVQWKKNGEYVNNFNRVLTLNETSVYGFYTCFSRNNSNVWSYFQVVPALATHIPRTAAVTVGEDFQTTCSGNFWPEVQIKWEFENKTYTQSADNVKLTSDAKNGINNAVITIENIENAGIKVIKCMAAYDWSGDSHQIAESSMDLLVTSQ